MAVQIRLQLAKVQNKCGKFLNKRKIDKYGKEFKNKNLIFDGIHGNVYVDMSTVAKIEVSEIDKGQMVLVKSKLNKDLEL